MKVINIRIESVFCLLFALFFCQQMVFSEESELTIEKRRRIEADAVYTYETIISLCQRERFDEIYEYGDKYSRERMSKERFVSEHTGCPLASSWEAVQDIEVKIISPTRVDLRAKLGVRKNQTVFYRVICTMKLEDGKWRVNLGLPFGEVERWRVVK